MLINSFPTYLYQNHKNVTWQKMEHEEWTMQNPACRQAGDNEYGWIL
jgi:hypothetical protein